MTPREFLVSETQEWLERSRADLQSSAALIAAALPAEALFHSQQCAEKAIKAYLTWHKVLFDKTHDLDDLKKLCVPLTTALDVELEGIGELTQYAWRFRYPGAPWSPDRAEAEEAMRMASALLDAIDADLNKLMA